MVIYYVDSPKWDDFIDTKEDILAIVTAFQLHLEEAQDNSVLQPPFYDTNTLWVDSIMQLLTNEQRIAQLFMVAAYSNKGEEHKNEIATLIQDYHIGGLMFMQGGPVRQAQLTNYYQSISNTPLMIAQDAEWGLSMRIDSTLRFPWQMTLGAIQDEALVYEMGTEIARQCKRLGVHINFAPVVDVNSNPNNPIINNRSFGEDPQSVAKLGIAYMQGLQDGGVLACAKHFPGHGDTDADSHKTLPVVSHTIAHLDSVDLIPFRKMISSGLGSVMVAHLYMPSLDDTENLASTLSPKIVDVLLKKEMGFNGLVFTDALNMKGVSQYYEPGEVDVKALLAGNDVLLFAEDVPKAIQKIKEAISKNQISQLEIDQRCRKILSAKKWFGLDRLSEVDKANLYEELTTKKTKVLNRKLIRNSITLLQNNSELIPINKLDTLKIASLSIGEDGTPFQSTLSKYASVDHFQISEKHSEKERKTILNQLAAYNLVIVSVHKSNKHAWKSYRINKETDVLLQTIAMQSKTILTLFANPYSISDLLMIYAFDGLIMAYQNAPIELAQYQYLLPRLTRMWTHLERQKGGIGMRGPGETQIETDRRIIQQKIALLKEKLKKIDKQKAIQRGNRGALVRVALVGYTNVGKSTIMNTLAKTKVLAENKLFATLDTTVRKIVVENVPFLLSDTVGFIRKLPHQLVESFKSTLDEVREADILLHVVDISHANFEEQIAIVNNTLAEIDGLDKPTIMVFNKIDAYTFEAKEEDDLTPRTTANNSLEDWKKTWMGKATHSIFISTLQKENWADFRKMLYEEVKKIHAKRFPYNHYLY